jgi:hypothetical protein
MAVTGLGVLMLATHMLTLGLLTITTAGGAMGGYLLRWRQSRQAMDRLSREVSEAGAGVPRLVGGRILADPGEADDGTIVAIDDETVRSNSVDALSGSYRRGRPR